MNRIIGWTKLELSTWAMLVQTHLPELAKANQEDQPFHTYKTSHHCRDRMRMVSAAMSTLASWLANDVKTHLGCCDDMPGTRLALTSECCPVPVVTGRGRVRICSGRIYWPPAVSQSKHKNQMLGIQ